MLEKRQNKIIGQFFYLFPVLTVITQYITPPTRASLHKKSRPRVVGKKKICTFAAIFV